MADTLAQVQKDVRFWQRLLTFAGYKPGKVDGVNGRKTKNDDRSPMKRAVIYARKSVFKGLDQAYNSLEARRTWSRASFIHTRQRAGCTYALTAMLA